MGLVVYFDFAVYCVELFSSVILLAAFLYFVYRYCHVSVTENLAPRRRSEGIKIERIVPTEETQAEGPSFPEKEKYAVHPNENLASGEDEKSLSDAIMAQIKSPSQARFVSTDQVNDQTQTSLRSKGSVVASKDALGDKKETNVTQKSKESQTVKMEQKDEQTSPTYATDQKIDNPKTEEHVISSESQTPTGEESIKKPSILKKRESELEKPSPIDKEPPIHAMESEPKPDVTLDKEQNPSPKTPVSELEKEQKYGRERLISKDESDRKLSRSGPKSSDPQSIFYLPKEESQNLSPEKIQEPETLTLTERGSETPKSKLTIISEEAQNFVNSDEEKEMLQTTRPNSILKNPEKERSEEHSFVEGVVCQAEDVPENGMKVCDLGEEGKVLLVKKNGRLSALGTKCSHYGASLINGALGDTRIRCPWHGACFNIETGDIEDFPGLDSIPCYNVQITPEGGVKVRAKISELKSNKKEKPLGVVDPNNSNTFVIIGGGAAGQVCAETLRQEGFSGKLIMITADKYHPYDRVKLSKQLDVTVDKIRLRPQDFYSSNSIEVKTETEVTGVNCTSKIITLSDGQEITYSSLFVATGGIPRILSLPGMELKNIFTLRSLNDANMIQSELSPDKNVVIYGSSFIGMEAAAYCVGKVKSVTVIGRSAVPFSVSFGKVIGERVAKLFTEKGVQMKMLSLITSFEGDGHVQKVILSDETELPADIVILGLGSAHATTFLKGSGIKMSEHGSVLVNKFLETNIPQVYAGGDIAEAPVFANKDTPESIGHWGLAHYHGRIAALNMMSKTTPLKTVPFFWTMIFGTSFRFAGTIKKHDSTIVKGDVDALKFAVYYMKNDLAIGVTTVGVDPIAAEFAECLHRNGSLRKSQIEANPLDWFKNI